jgi:hypothetical protein
MNDNSGDLMITVPEKIHFWCMNCNFYLLLENSFAGRVERSAELLTHRPAMLSRERQVFMMAVSNTSLVRLSSAIPDFCIPKKRQKPKGLRMRDSSVLLG